MISHHLGIIHRSNFFTRAFILVSGLKIQTFGWEDIQHFTILWLPSSKI